jgi:rSAM/selenodomain-associated transferase 2/rSAM/selenodomain-associated transferase 1
LAATKHLIEHLIIFTRYPQPGQAKTRLIPALGAEGAAALQRQMTEHTLKQVQTLLDRRSISTTVWFAGTENPEVDRQQMQAWLGSAWCYCPQSAGNLGNRMAYAVQAAFGMGAQRVVVIGTDCPSLGAEQLAQAFQILATHDLVLGPAVDGGYYLIGLSRMIPTLFTNIAWSTSEVFQQTVTAAKQVNLSIGYLATRADIDRPEDLPIWETVRQGITPPAISVIIPTLNEAHRISALIQAILPQGQLPRPNQVTESTNTNLEIIVVDGGSQDDTVTLAQQSGAIVLSAPTGRAQQMNQGAQIAAGSILLFLHADTRLPADWIADVQATLSRLHVVAGAFELHIDGQEPGLRWIEWGVKWRSRLLQLPYGDQALFLKAETFHQLGGFPALPIMEDFVFVRQLRSIGHIAIVPRAVTTSARRWHKLGILKTTLINQLVIGAYLLGVSPDRIARWYRQDGSGRRS